MRPVFFSCKSLKMTPQKCVPSNVPNPCRKLRVHSGCKVTFGVLTLLFTPLPSSQPEACPHRTVDLPITHANLSHPIRPEQYEEYLRHGAPLGLVSDADPWWVPEPWTDLTLLCLLPRGPESGSGGFGFGLGNSAPTYVPLSECMAWAAGDVSGAGGAGTAVVGQYL